MSFFRDVRTHLLINGVWVDTGNDVRQTSPVTITRGADAESRRPNPTKCTFTLNNRALTYSPKNPMSINYGKLGKNTPVRMYIRLARDLFPNTVSNGWGSADPSGIRDTTYPWTTTGGTSADFNTTPAAATHSINGTNTFRYTNLADVSYRDYGVYVKCTVAINDILGAAIEPANILLRGSGSNYLMVRVSVSAAEVLTVAVLTEASATIAAAVTVTGVVDAVSSKQIAVRAEVEGEVIRVKVWKHTAPEPYAWNIEVEDRTYLAAGWPGVRSGVASGNTNTKPILFTYSEVEVYSLRFHGEVSYWPQARTGDGRDAWVRVEAFDLFHRLTQGDAPLKSALRRGILGLTTPAVAYWPCEDGSNATSAASLSPAGPMAVTGTAVPSFASNSDFACSDSLPGMRTAAGLQGMVPAYTPTSGQTQVRFLLSVPAAGDVNGGVLMRVATTGGTTSFWDLTYGTGGTITLTAQDGATGAVLFTTGAVAFSLDGNPCRVSLELDQNGADIAWNLSTLRANAAATAGGISGTLAGNTYSSVQFVELNANGLLNAAGAGHVTVQNSIDTIFSLLSELIAYAGEIAETRVKKLCTQEGITGHSGVGTTPGQAMGPQRPLTLVDLWNECADTDAGFLGSMRGQTAVLYRRLNYLQNQAVACAVDYQQCTDATPLDDNFAIHNQIVAKRAGGSEYVAIQTTGPLAVSQPQSGGVGKYEDPLPVNPNTDPVLPDLARYALLKGTIDEPRWPSVTINHGTPEVRADEVLTRQLFDVDMSQRVQLSGASTAGYYDTQDELLLGYTETFTRKLHQLELNTAPYASYRAFLLDTDRLDDDGSTTLNEDLDTTEAGVDIAIAAGGALWTAADQPFNIIIEADGLGSGGEVMTVTAVTGAASPQTLTVTRSVNGVVKTHFTGARVRLAVPVYLAGW